MARSDRIRTILVDANVLIDYVSMRKPYYEKARLLMLLGSVGELDLWFSSSQATDLFYVLTDGGKPSLTEQAKEDIARLRRFMRICSVGEREIDEVAVSAWEGLEGALVHQAALSVKADAIVTRNQEDFRRSSIRVFDCDELFSYLEEREGFAYDEIALAAGFRGGAG